MEQGALVSVALTNVCDPACELCYVPESTHQLSCEELLEWCKQLDKLAPVEKWKITDWLLLPEDQVRAIHTHF